MTVHFGISQGAVYIPKTVESLFTLMTSNGTMLGHHRPLRSLAGRPAPLVLVLSSRGGTIAIARADLPPALRCVLRRRGFT